MDGRYMSEFGGGTDVQQIRIIAVVMITVLPEPAKMRHSKNCSERPGNSKRTLNCIY